MRETKRKGTNKTDREKGRESGKKEKKEKRTCLEEKDLHRRGLHDEAWRGLHHKASFQRGDSEN
jgi:hypothetical protein